MTYPKVDWKDPESVKQYRRAVSKAWRDNMTPEKKQKRKEVIKKYHDANKERIAENFARYYEKNKEKHREYLREYHKRNREKINEATRLRRLAKKNQAVDTEN